MSFDREFVAHPLRENVLNEIHARPFHMMAAPRIVLHYAFFSDAVSTAAAEARLIARWDVEDAPGSRHRIVRAADGMLRWESHTEFTTYSWDVPDPDQLDAEDGPFGSSFVAPGPLMVAIRLDLVVDDNPLEEILSPFDPGSLAVSQVAGGRGLVATDFRKDGNGLVRLLVIDRGFRPQEAGPLVQRFLEVETYRSFALLGLFEAQRLQPEVRKIETELVASSAKVRESDGLDASQALLDHLVSLAGDLEAGAAASAYRFGASRAYAEIMRLRLAAMNERPLEGYSSLSAFLDRRMMPAMRTCQSVEARQQDLSRKLARATALLRTRIDIELAQQNRALLDSMNQRARLQLRLQHTVEGLSVAAVTYYVVGLLSYIVKGVPIIGTRIDPASVIALSIIPVALLVRFVVRRVRSSHGDRMDL